MINKQLEKPLQLKDGARIFILGGGPAGAFLGIHLLKEAKKNNLDIYVTIVDKNLVLDQDGTVRKFNGCNFCAGVLSPRLLEELTQCGIILPREMVAESFSHIWIHGFWKNFPLKVPVGQRLVSVFRGNLPPGRQKLHPNFPRGFDAFLLQRAVDEGATLIAGEVLNIKYFYPSLYRPQNFPVNKEMVTPCLSIKPHVGNSFSVESDFVGICPGVNHNQNHKENLFWKSYQRLNPLFTPPVTKRALVFELKPGKNYLKKYMHREIYIIISGGGELKLDHVALVPKGDYLTVALTGKSVDKTLSSEDINGIIHGFLSLPHVQTILPGLDTIHKISKCGDTTQCQNAFSIDNAVVNESTLAYAARKFPVTCRCAPRMAVTPAKEAFCDKIAMAGDSLGARLYRDGLFSAFISARSLAQTVIHKGVDKKSLAQGCGWVLKWLEKDNHHGKRVMGVTQMALSSTLLSRILYQTFATEMKFKEKTKWPLGAVLWKVGSGAADYGEVCRNIVSPAVFSSILRGIYKTCRNILTEIFFDLNWDDQGRYPTVIIKEKRDYFKKSIAGHLGIDLDPHPEMERMYAIKIRADASAIFQELGKFGTIQSKFLKLRFVDVKNVSGTPLREGAVVQYRLKGLPISMDIQLIKVLPERVLFYEPAELFTKQGKLIFDITPTRDGNNRLVIYTAFDFQKGRTWPGRIFWTLFKHLFPDYAHDVVWNHAICTIKGEAEKCVNNL
ncbi:hypothetical protein SAMN02746065_108105 [Desulfocicer vacuolatum DSM 3385]|uniref:Uncharacterized protein n=1 Tax=Desulfocicer vacuolatum DSM 3385 TaxID=1121400 RepID=A0A1W2BHP7_9BACT|nr:hypothetical protein [Desulfocicer vacuolatum]SMC72463.1 hypothetical protein SAMN02746065_108105 [Desulfocicer vacuolatum DSM 3385]